MTGDGVAQRMALLQEFASRPVGMDPQGGLQVCGTHTALGRAGRGWTAARLGPVLRAWTYSNVVASPGLREGPSVRLG